MTWNVHATGPRRLGPLLAATTIGALLLWGPTSASAAPVYLQPARPIKDRVDDLLGQMTLAEKVGQMQQILITHVTNKASSANCPGCFGEPDPVGMQSVLIDNHAGSLLAGGAD